MSVRKFISLCIVFCIFLGKVTPSLAQVNLQSGSAVFSIPMFNWQDDYSRLSSTVALSYNSGTGLKVDDVASDVGEGWSLVAGGVITRLQVGLPDDQQAFIGTNPSTQVVNGVSTQVENDQDISKYPAGYLYETVSPNNGCPNALTKYPIYKGMNQLYTQHNVIAEDRQEDYFSFSFNGKSGMFVINTYNGTMTPQSLDDSKMILTVQANPAGQQANNIRTSITSFTIQDVNGLVYTFSQLGVTQVLHEDYCDSKQTAPLKQPTFKGNNVYYEDGFTNSQLVYTGIVNSWYLTKVTDPLTGRQITYNYIIRNINNTAGADVTYNQQGNYSIVSAKTSIVSTPVLSSIVYQDGHQVTFTYSTTPRVDLNGEYPLSKVDITYQGRAIAEYQLNTTYFILNRYGTPSSAYENSVARLCLRSVKKIGVDLKADSPPYLFDYNLGSSNADDFVPPPFFYAKDIWGFYNGYNSLDANGNPVPLNETVFQLNNTQLEGLCFYNSGNPGGMNVNKPNPGYAQNGLLRQIIYPTGGTLTYIYAQNTGIINPTMGVVNIGGVHVSQTQSTDGGYSNGCSSPLITNYNYVESDESTPSVWGLEMPQNEVTTANSYASEDKVWHWALSCGSLFGCCYWKYEYPGIMSQLQAVSLSSFQEVMQVLAPYLGIVNIITDIMDVATVVGGDTGVLAIASVIIDAIGSILTVGFSCGSSNNAQDNTSNVWYNANLNGASPLPTQYNRVEIVEGSGTAGKTVQQFTDSSDYALWVGGGQNTDFSNKQRFAPWAYGLPKLISTYDVSGNLIKQIKNVYSFQYAQNELMLGPLNKEYWLQDWDVNCKCGVINTYSQNNTDWTNPTLYNATYNTGSDADMTVDIYDMYSGHTELDSSYETAYSTVNPSQFVQTYKAYQYDENNYQIASIYSTRSDGSQMSEAMTYSDQWPLLSNNNILEEVIDDWSAVNNVMSYEKATAYVTLTDGNIVPGTVWEQRFAQPGSNGGTFYPGGTPTSAFHAIQTYTYDINSNMTGVTDEGGRTMTNIYDYNSKYVVAVVTNANPALDHAAYTSFETSTLGGWMQIDANAMTYSTTAITGAQSLILNGHTLAATLNTADAYTLSFWSTSSINVPGSLVVSGPTINGFTFYQYTIPQGTTNVAVTGNANIDELRLYPQTSRMKTTTYDPLLGKTSECDDNNRVTYYTYDNYGRLQFTEDEYHNVLKMNEYNNISAAKQNGCPGTYSNPLITEYFQFPCSVGFQGNMVAYSIPAGTYTSAISQQDADIQAEIALIFNGLLNVASNPNGTCSQVWTNQPESQSDSTLSCPEGEQGGWVTYSVPAGRYSSIISQQDANNQALAEIAANAQAYADAPATQSCSLTTTPDWTWAYGGSYYCTNVGGVPHEFLLATDNNPNSSTYNQTEYIDGGEQASCPIGTYTTPVIASNTTTETVILVYTNTSTGTSYSFTVTPGSNNVNEGSVPDGPYNIFMEPQNYSSSYAIVSTLNNSTQTYYATVEYGGQLLTGTAPTITLSPDPQITVTLNDGYSNPIDVSFTNTSSNVTYSYTAPVGQTLIFSVPEGTYNVTMKPTAGSVRTTLAYELYSSGQEALSTLAVTYSNVSVTTTCAITVTVYAP